MKFLHLIILTFTLISNSTFANKTEEIVIRCERGNGKYTPWLRYINKSDGNSNTVTADVYGKNKSTGKSEWQTQPCLYKEWSSTPKDGERVTKYVRGVIEGKILSCETESYNPYPKLKGKAVYLTDFEKLKKINRIFKVNGELFSDETYSCETLAQKKAKDREVKVKENKDRTYAGVIMGSKFSENEILKKDWGSEVRWISYKYAGLRAKAFFYNNNFEEDYPKYRWEDSNPTLINDPTIEKIEIKETLIERGLRDKILESIDSKYQLLSSNTENTKWFDEESSKKTLYKKYSNKGDEIYVEATDNYNVPKLQQLINKPYTSELKIVYTSKDLARAEKLAAKLEADKVAKEKAASDTKLKNEISGF